MLVKILAIALITLLARPADPADPADPATALIELEQGGLGGHFRPRVEVLADGTVRVDGVAAATKLARGELAELIEFVVEKQGFFKIDGKKLKRTLERRQVGYCGTGLTIARLTADIDGKRATVTQTLLESMATVHPDIEDLIRLRDITRRLQLEARLAQSEGRAKVEGWLTRANRKLKQKHPKVPPLAIADFSRLAEVPGKGKCAIFNRHETNPPRAVSAQVPVKAKQADVTVNVQQ